jgi:heme-degrading monooxygenase HmoA
MVAVIFEVRPKPAGRAAYLDLAAELRPRLQQINGFISIERFASLSDPDKILSLSFWQDEEAVAAWRREEAHREAQRRGRNHLFEDYRLRIAGVIRDYGMTQRDQAPADSHSFHEGAAPSTGSL